MKFVHIDGNSCVELWWYVQYSELLKCRMHVTKLCIFRHFCVEYRLCPYMVGCWPVSLCNGNTVLKCNINVYNIVHTQFNILLFIIPATCFGPIVRPSSGWSLSRWYVLLKDKSEDGRTVGPKHVAGIIT